MSDTSFDAQPPRWWPGRTRAIIGGMLAALAVPLIVFTAWMFVWIVDAFYCDRASHGGGADACEEAAIRFIVGVTLGPVTLALGGAMMLCAAGLFLRPGLRGRVMLIIGGLIIGTPIALVLVYLIKRFI